MAVVRQRAPLILLTLVVASIVWFYVTTLPLRQYNTTHQVQHSPPQTCFNGTLAKPQRLVIGMITSPRQYDLDFLNPTLQSLYNQLAYNQATNKDSFVAQIKVLVFDTAKSANFDAFKRAKKRFEKSPFADNFEFVHIKQPKKQQEQHFLTPLFAQVLKTLQQTNAEYIMLTEDDFEFCDNSLLAFKYAIIKAHLYVPNWRGIRTGYGTSNFIMPRASIAPFLEHVETTNPQQPIDHKLRDFLLGFEHNVNDFWRVPIGSIGYRYNLMEHKGRLSSHKKEFRAPDSACYEEYAPNRGVVESYRASDCPQDDMSPCQQHDYLKENVLNFKSATQPNIDEWFQKNLLSCQK